MHHVTLCFDVGKAVNVQYEFPAQVLLSHCSVDDRFISALSGGLVAK